jgi:Icc-related predicted phosphoesterase
MWQHVFSLVPGLLVNRLRYGRFLDFFVTHAPPLGIHDMHRLPHQGIRAFRWLLKTFQPKYHLHGHIHVYRDTTQTETRLGNTLVVNTYGFLETEFKII